VIAWLAGDRPAVVCWPQRQVPGVETVRARQRPHRRRMVEHLLSMGQSRFTFLEIAGSPDVRAASTGREGFRRRRGGAWTSL